MARPKGSGKPKVKPTAGHILIEPVEAERRTASGIVLPETAEEKPQEGRVIAVGPEEVTDSGAKRKPPCKAGDKVIYKKWGGNEVKIGSKEYLFVKFDDILAVMG